MKSLKIFSLISSMLFILTVIMSLNIDEKDSILKSHQPVQDTIKWVAPFSSDSLVNPIKSNEESIAEGLLIYKRNCRSCHGKKGDGRGVEAAELTTPSTDFTNPSFTEQSDGSMFWKIREGRNDMESYKEMITEEETWQVINYIKTFSPSSDNWIAPASDVSLKNPVKSNEESIAEGTLIYKRNCRSCHGKKGNGRGIEAADLTTPSTDFTNPSFTEQSDGSMFWKIREGRNDMESFKDEISEVETWQVVNYIKTFSPAVNE